jgi:hypothetical protein
LEKGDAEHLSLMCQRHEIHIQQMMQDMGFIQLKNAEENTNALLTSRATTIERLRYYQRLLGLPADVNAPDTITISDRPDLTEENFADAFQSLINQYGKTITCSNCRSLSLQVPRRGSRPVLQVLASYISTRTKMPISTLSAPPRAATGRTRCTATPLPEFSRSFPTWGSTYISGGWAATPISSAGRFCRPPAASTPRRLGTSAQCLRRSHQVDVHNRQGRAKMGKVYPQTGCAAGLAWPIKP